MACIACGEDREIEARGWCRRCYQRLRKTEEGARKYRVNRGKACGVDGCEKKAFAKGLCQTHYHKADHPLKTTWKLLRSRAGKGGYPSEWESFGAFLEDVGSRPSPQHRLRRPDPEQPWSVDNIEWLRVAEYSSQDPKYSRASNFRKYGITIADYEAMLAAQKGVCAICGKRESHTYKSGKIKSLAVDHCHDSDKVRGLLCYNCNRGLGHFQDDLSVLRTAVAYLERAEAQAA